MAVVKKQSSKGYTHWTLAIGLAVLLVAGLVTVFSFVKLLGGEDRYIWDGEAESLDDLLVGWASAPSVPGVILQVTGPQGIIYSGSAGHLTTKGQGELTSQTPFHTASVGKLFTAATVLRLFEQGKIDLDAPLTILLPADLLEGFAVIDGVSHLSEITPRRLLSHRSGLGNTDRDLGFSLAVLFRPNKAWTPEDLIEVAKKVPPVDVPGARTSYASPGYYLLGLIIEAVTGRPYHEVVREEIFDRLAMTHTFEATHEWDPALPCLHHYAGPFDLATHNPSFEFADGGFVTTADDLAIFARALMGGDLFERPETGQVFVEPWSREGAPKRYRGLGPAVVVRDDGEMLVWHSGYWGVLFITYPERETSVVLSLAQSGADYKAFWRQASQVLARDGGPVLPPLD